MTEIQQMRNVAAKGDPEDMYMYGSALLSGSYELWNGEVRKCRRNISEALEWLEKSAKAGCVGAMLEMGRRYYEMRPRKRENMLRALRWEKLAWKSGDMDAANNLAMTYAILGQPAKCHALMLKVIASGEDPKSWRYGHSLLCGNCRKWLGEDVKFIKNEKEGFRILEEAADNGDTEAMIGLGNYYSDTSVDWRPDFERSLFWTKTAWRKGEVIAAQNIAITYMKLKRPKECHAWLKRGYKKCRWPVALSLAKTYICGYGTKRDIDKARIILERIVDPSENSYPSDVRKARRYLKEIEQGKAPKCD